MNYAFLGSHEIESKRYSIKNHQNQTKQKKNQPIKQTHPHQKNTPTYLIALKSCCFVLFVDPINI